LEESTPCRKIRGILALKEDRGIPAVSSHWMNIGWGMLVLEEYWKNPSIGGILGESSHSRSIGGILALRDILEYWRDPRIGGRLRNIGGIPALGNIEGILALEEYSGGRRSGGRLIITGAILALGKYWGNPRLGGYSGVSEGSNLQIGGIHIG
jgi:hypothetical protein